jgi:Cdc6-like AAA superfamily ATPase
MALDPDSIDEACLRRIAEYGRIVGKGSARTVLAVLRLAAETADAHKSSTISLTDIGVAIEKNRYKQDLEFLCSTPHSVHTVLISTAILQKRNGNATTNGVIELARREDPRGEWAYFLWVHRTLNEYCDMRFLQSSKVGRGRGKGVANQYTFTETPPDDVISYLRDGCPQCKKFLESL